MAAPRTCLTLAILMVTGILICSNNMVSAQCGGSFPDVIAQCSKYVQKTGPKIPPSPACCSELKKFDIPCACKLVPKEAVNFVSIPKVIFVARSCGLNVAGLKCGPIKFPPARR